MGKQDSQDPSSCFEKPVAYHNWLALPHRKVTDIRIPFELTWYLKPVLKKKVRHDECSTVWVSRSRIQV